MMKQALLIAAFAPVLAVAYAGEKPGSSATVSQEKLQGTVPISNINGRDVLAPDGADVGDVQDVLLDSNGRIVSLIVAREQSENSDGYGESEASELAVVDVEREVQPPGEDAASGDIKLDWSQVTYDRNANAFRLNSELESISTVDYNADDLQQVQGVMQASAIQEMDVNLSDSAAYGEVEDILVDPQRGEVVALVVDAGGFFTSETYAVPFQAATMNEQEQEMTLQQAEQDFEEAEEFDIESITDAT